MRQSRRDSTLRILLDVSQFVVVVAEMCISLNLFAFVLIMSCSNWSNRVIGETAEETVQNWSALVIAIRQCQVSSGKSINEKLTRFREIHSRVVFILLVAHFILLWFVYLFSNLRRKQSYAVRRQWISFFSLFLFLAPNFKDFSLRISRNRAWISPDFDCTAGVWHFIYVFNKFKEVKPRNLKENLSQNSQLLK
jgi:hypothetical protein